MSVSAASLHRWTWWLKTLLDVSSELERSDLKRVKIEAETCGSGNKAKVYYAGRIYQHKNELRLFQPGFFYFNSFNSDISKGKCSASSVPLKGIEHNYNLNSTSQVYNQTFNTDRWINLTNIVQYQMKIWLRTTFYRKLFVTSNFYLQVYGLKYLCLNN